MLAVVHLPRASPLPKVTLRGVIQVTNAVDGQILGYISKNSFSGAQYRYQPSIGDALIVTFPINIGAITAVNVRITSEVSAYSINFTALTFDRQWDRTLTSRASLFWRWYRAGTPTLSTLHQVLSSRSSSRFLGIG